MADVRDQIVKWARWGVDNHAGFTYTEGGNRMEGIGHPGVPCHCDCSAFVTLCYNWAGAPDPNGQGYNGSGYTGTLLSHGVVILKNQAVPGDIVVYGPGTGDHTAMIVEAGNDPLTVSMGEQGDPNYIRVSQDGRQPQRFLRFSTIASGTASAAPSVSAGGNGALQVGSKGLAVVAIQKVLQAFHYYGGALDGDFGPQTKAAVIAYQNALKINPDGVWGPATQQASDNFGRFLAAQASSAKTGTPTTTPHPTIAQGASGAAVVALQNALHVQADGSFGPVTNSAVRTFQQKMHLAVDGIVGPQTWKALGL